MQKKYRKGIILAGGSGTRLHPLTKAISKQLLPVYNKPMIYYPLSVLMLSGIRDILIISQSSFIPLYKSLFGNGNQLGLNITYATQDKPGGIAEAFIIGEEFIDGDDISLILGDNIFYSASLSSLLETAHNDQNANIFCTTVSNPRDFGVLKLTRSKTPGKIIEKPKKFIGNLAITGLYYYNNEVIKVAKQLKASDRGELEISDINTYFLKKNKLRYHVLPRGALWLDTGTFENLYQCSNIIQSIEKNTNIMIGCIEEIALKKEFISKKDLNNLIKKYSKNEYTSYLKKLIK